MEVKIEGKTLIIRLELEDNPQPSASGKTLVVASTHGNIGTAATHPKHPGKPIVIGVNAYIKP